MIDLPHRGQNITQHRLSQPFYFKGLYGSCRKKNPDFAGSGGVMGTEQGDGGEPKAKGTVAESGRLVGIFL